MPHSNNHNHRRERSISIPINNWTVRAFAWCVLFTAFVLSAVSTGSCRFIQATQFEGQSDVTVIHMGIFKYEASAGVCVSLSLPSESSANTFEFTSAHKVAKAMAVLACLIGGLNMLSFLSVFFSPIQRAFWLVFPILSCLCMMFQGMTFLLFNVDECHGTKDVQDGFDRDIQVKCEVAEGGSTALAAIAAYLLGAIFICAVPAPANGPLFSCELIGDEEVAYSRASQLEQSLPASATSHATAHGMGRAAPVTEKDVKETVTETRNPDGTKTTFITRTSVPISDQSGTPSAERFEISLVGAGIPAGDQSI